MKKLLLVFLLIPAIGFSQGKLKDAKQNLSSSSSSSSSSSTSSSSRSSSSSSSSFDGSLDAFFLELFLFMSYKTALGEFEYRHFTPYPYYYDNVNGEYDFGLEEGDKRSLFRVGGNYLIGNIINSAEVNINYRFNPFVGAELSHHRFSEKVRNGREHLDVTSLLFNYYRIRERSFSAWWGVGLTYVGNEVGTAGFAYNFGTEIYPFKPISFHASYKQSLINESNIGVLKLQAKYHRKKMAYYTGYHDISLGGVKASGLVLGIEYRF